MINKLELANLPFVDGVPEADQKRIEWIRNGDCLTAATTKYGHDGALNAAALGVQTNVETLEKNDTTTKDKVNEIVDSVNQIKEALDISTDASVIQQIETNRLNIVSLQTGLAETDIALLDTSTNLGELQEDVGYYNPLEDGPYLTVRANINRIKREMGHYANQDINGDPLPEGETNDATGMKRIIIDNSTAIATTQRRLTILEENYNDSDVGGLTIKLNEMREELGPRTEGIGKSPVYTRLTAVEAKAETNETDIGNIKTAIGFGQGQSIANRVGTLETKTTNLENTTSGMNTRLSKVETDIGTDAELTSINGRLKTLRDDMTGVRVVIGESSSAGLQGQVVALNVAVGISDSPAPTSLIPRMQAVETTSRANSTTIQDIQAEIGNNQSGIKGSILTIKSQIEGTNPNGSTVTEKGILPTVEGLVNEMPLKVTDAPVDDKLYGRKDAAWVEIVDSTAAIDGVKADLVLTDGRVATLSARVDTNDTSIGSLETRYSALNTSVTGIKADVVALQEKDVEQDGRISALEASDVTITGKITALETQVTNIDTDVTQLALDISDVEGQLVPIKADVSKNKGDIVTLTGRVGANEGEIADIKLDTAKIAPLATRVTTAEGKITALETSTSNIDTEIEAIKLDTANIAGISTKADSNEGKITTLEGKVSTAETDIAAIKLDTAKIDPLTARVVTVEGKVGVLEGQMVDVETEVAKIPAIKTEADKVAGINTRLGTAEGKITTLETGLAAVKVESDKVAGIDTRLGVVEGKVSTLETGLAAVKVESDKVADLGTRLTAAEGKITALETELAKRPPAAPTADGLPYVLVDNAWILLSDFVTLNPAP